MHLKMSPAKQWPFCLALNVLFNTLRPRGNEQHFPNVILKHIFFNENVWISMKISLKFVPKGPINNIPALVQIMAWHRSGDKPLSEPMMVSLPTHICVTRPQWVRWSCVSQCQKHQITIMTYYHDNLLAPGIGRCHRKLLIFKLITSIDVKLPSAEWPQTLLLISQHSLSGSMLTNIYLCRHMASLGHNELKSGTKGYTVSCNCVP